MALDNKWAFGKYEATLIPQHIKCILNILNVNPTIIRHKNYIYIESLCRNLQPMPSQEKIHTKKAPFPKFCKRQKKRKYLTMSSQGGRGGTKIANFT